MSLHAQKWGKWYDGLLNSWPLLLDSDVVHTVGIAWIFKENGRWVVRPRMTGAHQFYNAQFFIRVGIPFALFFGMRLSSTRLFQCGLGWKQNGRIAALFRFQTDASAAQGVHSPNPGQATGWDYGEH